MTAQHPIITYRLRSNGTIPPFLCKHPESFAGMFPVNTNKPGFIPAWLPPQETKYLGMACGPVDPDGCATCVHVIETKEELDAYITEATDGQLVEKRTLVREWKETKEGTEEQFNGPSDPSLQELFVDGTLQVFNPLEPVESDLVEHDLPEGEIIRRDQESTLSVTKTDVDGVVTIKEVTSYKEYAITEVPFDPIAASDELWARYELVNAPEPEPEVVEEPIEGTILEP